MMAHNEPIMYAWRPTCAGVYNSPELLIYLLDNAAEILKVEINICERRKGKKEPGSCLISWVARFNNGHSFWLWLGNRTWNATYVSEKCISWEHYDGMLVKTVPGSLLLRICCKKIVQPCFSNFIKIKCRKPISRGHSIQIQQWPRNCLQQAAKLLGF